MDEKQEVLLIKSYKFFQFISSIQILALAQSPFFRKNRIHLAVKSKHQLSGSETNFKQSYQYQVTTR